MRLIYIALSLLIFFYLADSFAVENWNPVWHTTRVTYNQYCYQPKMYEGKIVYSAWVGNQTEAFFWNGSSTTRLTNTPENEGVGGIWENEIVWSRYNTQSSQSEIFYRTADGITHQLTNTPEYNEHHPTIWNSQVAWDVETSAPEYDVVFWDGNTTRIFHTRNQSVPWATIGNGKIAWMDSPPGTYRVGVKMWDGTSESFISGNGSRIDYFSFDGYCAAWERSGDLEYWNGENITIIDIPFSIGYGSISVSKGFVVFQGVTSINDARVDDIYLWHAGQLFQITNSITIPDEYPFIWVGDGKVQIAYLSRMDTNHNYPDVIYAWAAITEPSTFALISMSLPLYSLWFFAKRKKDNK